MRAADAARAVGLHRDVVAGGGVPAGRPHRGPRAGGGRAGLGHAQHHPHGRRRGLPAVHHGDPGGPARAVAARGEAGGRAGHADRCRGGAPVSRGRPAQPAPARRPARGGRVPEGRVDGCATVGRHPARAARRDVGQAAGPPVRAGGACRGERSGRACGRAATRRSGRRRRPRAARHPLPAGLRARLPGGCRVVHRALDHRGARGARPLRPAEIPHGDRRCAGRRAGRAASGRRHAGTRAFPGHLGRRAARARPAHPAVTRGAAPARLRDLDAAFGADVPRGRTGRRYLVLRRSGRSSLLRSTTCPPPRAMPSRGRPSGSGPSTRRPGEARQGRRMFVVEETRARSSASWRSPS